MGTDCRSHSGLPEKNEGDGNDHVDATSSGSCGDATTPSAAQDHPHPVGGTTAACCSRTARVDAAQARDSKDDDARSRGKRGDAGFPEEEKKKMAEDDCCRNTGPKEAHRVCSNATTCCGSEERCDEECIRTAAALECERACDEDSGHNDVDGHHHPHDKNGRHPKSACTTHLRRAFDRYTAYLEQARCICRSVLERRLSETLACCGGANKKGGAGKSEKAKKAVVKGSAAVYPTVNDAAQVPLQRGEYNENNDGLGANDGTPSPHGETSIAESLNDDELAITPRSPCDESGCCAPKRHAVSPLALDKTNSAPIPEYKRAAARGRQADIEQNAGVEIVAVAIGGMDCSGCSDKMTRAFQSVPGVSQVRVNFVLGSADFSVDTSIAEPDEVIRHVEATTGLRCTRVAGGSDYTLDFVASSSSSRSITSAAIKALIDGAFSIDGVTDAEPINRKTVKVTYDPAIVGAREIYDELGARSGGLAQPDADPALATGRKRLWDQAAKTLLAAVLTIPVVVLAWGDMLDDEMTKAIVSIVLAFFVQLIAVPEFYRPALSSLIRSRVLEMDMLVVISITAAFLYSLVAFAFRMAGEPLETAEFFETSTLLITLILLGRLIATYARVKAVSAVSLRSLQTNTAVLIDKDGKERELDARLLQYGDQLRILPHSRVPTDGVIIEGLGEVDESMLTGEAMPVPKRPGENIIAGTINGDGAFVARLTRLPGKNTVSDIAQMVEDAANSKPRLQDLANKVASWFVPVVSAISVLVLIVWIAVGMQVRNESPEKAAADAVTYMVAVLAVSCPCALGLAVPMVLVVAGGIAARGGIIIKSAECTERARKCTDVIFDKTGTITEGDLDVVEEEYLTPDENEAIGVAKSLVASSKHPVSAAVEKHLESSEAPTVPGASAIRMVPGAGVEARLENGFLRAGNPRWTETESNPAVARFREAGLTTLVVVKESFGGTDRCVTPLAVFGLRTQLRPEACRVVAELKARKIAVHLVSGDEKCAVRATAAAVGIPPENVAGERTPAEKRDYVAAIKSRDTTATNGGRGAYVLFCGDGTNDAVAVAQADVGVQMGGGLSSSDVTQGAADVVLLAGLEGLPFLLDVSRAAFRRMALNFVWSAVYNVFAILLAAGAFVRVRIPPAYAGLGEIVSVMPVILAALSMLLLDLRGKRRVPLKQ